MELEYPTNYLQSLRFPGFPVHKLRFKIGSIVMLIRNISINDGLCNGTRLKILNLYNHNIEAEIITGNKINTIVFIPRIILDTNSC
uniref:DNA helicase Pif1-like 2B domain-containing protein n=1 Tax=Trichogramma kaykai TaxID=54128 RepID=A0ABD2WPE2_9HYME